MRIKIFFMTAFLINFTVYGQLKKMGLGFNKVTSITIADNSYYGKFIVAGTENSGTYFHSADDNDTAWANLFSKSVNISSVYAQELDSYNTKLFMAQLPDTSVYSPLIYSNVMPVQSAIIREDSGLDRSKVKIIRSISGFNYLPGGIQMPVFCCTNDPAVYKYGSRSWSKAWEGPFFVNFNFVYAKDSTVWAGGLYNGIIASPLLIKSTDFGSTWDTLNLPVGEVFSCYSLHTSPGNPDLVFVGLNEHILKSTDGGKSWKDCLPDIYQVIFTGIVINPEVPSQIFAGGRTYDNTMMLFKSDDNGNNWEQLLTDCNCIFKGISTMAGTVINNKFVLYLGTYGEGLFQYSDNVSKVETNYQVPEGFKLYQNYPNPFNPGTKIKYNIPKNSKVIISIIDVLGRGIKTLLNEYQNAGIHEINFDASGLTSGIYFYKVTAGKYTAVKKMILLK